MARIVEYISEEEEEEINLCSCSDLRDCRSGIPGKMGPLFDHPNIKN